MPDGQPPVYDPNTRRAPLTPVTPHAGTYGGTAGVGAGGPGFKYDRATLEQLAKDWNSLADEFRDDLAKANVIAGTRGPGREYASDGNAEMIRASGSALVTTLFERQRFCREVANKFNAALGKYATTEDAHSTEIKQTGGSL
ncbi:hypothetical protein [Amycolatopsis sp. SID8362]|uniref:hypothetical protein n=1 Tax=Amycolatopsis sp. SID8362 TaxID=2690346 RepID=UPI001369844C|nr:hypothetical protein [Amycolatopsis sp. SID8362]NBH11855.1 hypothetical protein [Amycolatopsis sp. SID8362]NED48546.1 hypothetical protein [Amycolatopsis sp. SID8362]